MPVYPDDLLMQVRQMQIDIQRLFTSLNTKPAFNRVENGPLVVGRVGTRQITLNPDGATNPEIWLDPDGTGANPTRISAEVGGGGTATLVFRSGSSAGVDSSLTLAYNEVSMESGSGGFAFWGSDEARFGYSTNNYFRFGASICRHFGQWDDYQTSGLNGTSGIVPGSLTTPGAQSSWTVDYPAFMSGNMGPVCTVRRSTANFRWCITSSNASSFTVSIENSAESFAIYFWSFRH